MRAYGAKANSRARRLLTKPVPPLWTQKFDPKSANFLVRKNAAF
jgi:hypothetical protein